MIGIVDILLKFISEICIVYNMEDVFSSYSFVYPFTEWHEVIKVK